MKKIGVLKKVELRDIWSREDIDFTNWLNDNLDILGDAIGLDLGTSETECFLDNSDLRVDIRAITKEGKPVVIENQLEQTNHKHLGQIMTYIINMEAKIAVWIAKKIRQEHIKVIEWLNDSTDKDFYLIQLESYQIDNSQPAPFFKIICQPSLEMKKISRHKKEESEGNQLKIKFWDSFLEKAKSKTDFFSKDKTHWWTGRHKEVRKTGILLGCRVNKDKTAVSIIFNPNLKDKLFKLKGRLESEVGFVLKHVEKDQSRGYVKTNKEELLKWFDKGGYRSPQSEWNQIQDSLIDHFVKLEKGLKQTLKEWKSLDKVA